MEHAGAAAATTLSSSITNAATTINVTSATGWPTGSVGPFVTTLDAGTASEEKVLALSRTGTVLTVSTRGYDGTTAVSHASGAAIFHSFSATEADEANVAAVALTGVSGLNSAWTAYTPTYNGFTVGTGTAVYKQIGKTVHVLVNVELTSAVTASMRVSLPVTASANMLNGVVGSCFGQDTSVGAFYTGVAYCATTGLLGFISNGATAAWGNAVPHTWASSDQLRFVVTYEAA